MMKLFFQPPVFENDEDNFRARFINGFAWAVIVLLAGATIPYILNPVGDYTVAVTSGLIVVMLIALYLLRRKKIKTSGFLIVLLGWLGLGVQAYTADGVKDVIVMAYIALGLLASIVVGWRAGGLVVLASISALWALAFLEANGQLTPRQQDPITYARDLSLVFLAIAVLIYFSTTSLREAIARASRSEANLRELNQDLLELNQTLENRVSSRTAELESANQHNEKRARQFEAIAQVARATTTNQDLSMLLPSLTELISTHFGFYHVGIFLLDDNQEFAVLQAANSEGGQRMLARGHKLGVGKSGIVGFVSATGKPRIALDVGADAVFFNNPDLPNTRSEMALPVQAAGAVMGALDVQSVIPNAFQEEDIEVLSALADQVAIAIQNARSYETTQELLKEAQRTSGSVVQDAWRILQDQGEEAFVGYQVAGDQLTRLKQPLSSALIHKALSDKETFQENGEKAALAVPIRLREAVIGVINIRVPDTHEWDEDEVDITQAIADRLSLALESSLLLNSTRRRAEIERITTDISDKIGTSTQFNTILRTAAEELSRALGGSEVLVQIQPEVFETPKEQAA